MVRTPPWSELLDDALRRCRGAVGIARFEKHRSRGRQRGLQEAIAAALAESPSATKPQPGRQQFGLTRRELEIVQLIGQGLTNKEIATKLVISIRTAEGHVQNILTKTGFSTRGRVAAWHAALNQRTEIES